MKVRFSKRVTFEGFTYLPDQEYEVGEKLASRLEHNFGRFMQPVADAPAQADSPKEPVAEPKPTRTRRGSKVSETEAQV